ncbi:hypothetical protein ACQRCM_15510 [Parabacteroides merdae]|uniref:hypothetical protein n=1 Tax=Parabacteroides TaxID=375288 RepID=UPI002852C4E9|nr:hypothetical protein [Parabacteroides sp.]
MKANISGEGNSRIMAKSLFTPPKHDKIKKCRRTPTLMPTYPLIFDVVTGYV